jgi:hypothetical protein
MKIKLCSTKDLQIKETRLVAAQKKKYVIW